MTTEIKRRSYEEIDTIFKNKHDLILKNNSEIASLIEEMIYTSFYLSEIMKAVFLKEYKKTGKEFEGPSALIPILWDKNNKYLIASYKLAMVGLINPSNSLIRNVFEGTTQIYLLHLTDREAELFYKKQLETLTPDEKKEWKRKYNHLGASKVREILYDSGKKELLKKFYSEISNATHPSIKSAMSDAEVKDEIIKDTLGGILSLGIANIIAFNEIYSDKYDGGTIEIVNNLVEKVFKVLGGEMIDIVPNHPSFSGKLKFAFKST